MRVRRVAVSHAPAGADSPPPALNCLTPCKVTLLYLPTRAAERRPVIRPGQRMLNSQNLDWKEGITKSCSLRSDVCSST
eukprot:1161316-Pelagomonas_calceolata.AAC.6